MNTHDYEILALSKKALNIVIPWMANHKWDLQNQNSQMQQSQMQ
jgi:hypothetical protein